jgi:hypothetical protein
LFFLGGRNDDIHELGVDSNIGSGLSTHISWNYYMKLEQESLIIFFLKYIKIIFFLKKYF